jgi:hypothetical protein
LDPVTWKPKNTLPAASAVSGVLMNTVASNAPGLALYAAAPKNACGVNVPAAALPSARTSSLPPAPGATIRPCWVSRTLYGGIQLCGGAT